MLKKLMLASVASAALLTGCYSSIDKEVTLIRGETTVAEVEDILGSPQNQAMEGNRLKYEYTSSHLGRDIITGLAIGWQFLDNHVLTLCDPGRVNCKLFKAGDDDDAKSLRVYFENGTVSDAYTLDL